MMGSGKSSVGRLLQKRTGLRCFDVDEMLAAKFALTISEIFAKHGEEKFRDAETAALKSLERGEQAIVATGGGIVLRKENVDLLQRLGRIVWLDADQATLFKRASRKGDRPLLKTENARAAFADLLRTRTPLYAKMAQVRINTSTRTLDDIVDLILGKIESLAPPKK
ncbi:MAG: shikimate kinase / 3-dehydroquinate synthase [Verrucomicrobiota bacterium]|jgi:shikimate kinase